MNYEFYVCDTETTGLDDHKHDVIEVSLFRLSTNEQKTWSIKPFTPETASSEALRVNGHKIEDLSWLTKIGKDRYLDPTQVIVDIENWVLDDGVPASDRVLIGQNIGFDIGFLKQLWEKCNSFNSFPFGRRSVDTMSIELFLDYCQGIFAEGYSLKNLVKKYGVKNTAAHTAAADTLATKEVFLSQVEFFKKVLLKNNA